ncbi:hypothetical protein ACWC09_34960 [Streptomyces sp. NPDC001617]
MPDAPVISPAQLVSGNTYALVLDADGGPEGSVLAVDLDTPAAPEALAAAARRARACDRILVGVTEAASGDLSPNVMALAEALDMTLAAGEPAPGDRFFVSTPDPSAALAEITAGVATAPQAALVLAGLLRMTGTLSVRGRPADAFYTSSPSLDVLREGLSRCLPDLPPAVHVERAVMTRHLITQMCAERERALAENAPTPRASWHEAATGLIDAVVALWEAPVTPED